MKQTVSIILFIIILLLLGAVGTFLFIYWPGLKPVLLPAVPGAPTVTDPIPNDTNEVVAPDGFYITGDYTLPNGFELRVLTDMVPNARDIIIGPRGEIIVSQHREGKVSIVDRETGKVTTILDELNNPHGLLLDSQNEFRLYIAEEDVLSAVTLYSEASSYEELISLPEGGRHFTRSLVYNADGEMLISIGSTCDTCIEDNPLHGTIQKVNLEDGTLEPYATGLRNSVFMTLHELDGSLWATEMGRDMLGDDLPPDELNQINEGEWHGWPWYYGNNVFDEDFADGRMVDVETPPTSSTINLQAHVAPLGLDTVPEEGWPEEYWYDLIVAYHGSWNRSVPVGYEVVRHRFDSDMNYLGQEPFISGWLTDKNRAIGRPVDVLTLPGGTMYISDDKGGRIYEVTYTGSTSASSTTSTGTPLPYISEVEQNTITLNTTELSGEALGTWYFEADFPIDVIDTNNQVLETLIASAQSDWMTTSSVPFTTNFDASQYTGQTIAFTLRKDNPSGMPSLDASTTTDYITIQ